MQNTSVLPLLPRLMLEVEMDADWILLDAQIGCAVSTFVPVTCQSDAETWITL